MDGYYDYGPRVVLDKPLALVGFMGSRSSATGYALTAVTGLPFSELERLVEHEAGCSRAQLVRDRGQGELARLEARALNKALARRPHGIIVLSDTTLMDPDSQKRLLNETTLIYIKRPLGILFQEVRQRVRTGLGNYPEFRTSPPTHIDELRAFYDARRASYQCAHIIHDAMDHHPSAVAQDLMKILKL